MAQLIFYDEDHRYEKNGVEYASVSEIARFVSREIYGDVTQWRLDNACDRGSRVHSATENLDRFGSVECDEDVAQYISAYVKFRKENDITKDNIVAIEQPVSNDELLVAGTIDRVIKLNGKTIIIDLKTSSQVKKSLALIQLNAYKHLWECEGKGQVDELWIVQLKNDGTYRVVPIEMDAKYFNACLTLHQLLKKKTRKAKGEEK